MVRAPCYNSVLLGNGSERRSAIRPYVLLPGSGVARDMKTHWKGEKMLLTLCGMCSNCYATTTSAVEVDCLNCEKVAKAAMLKRVGL